MVMEELLRAGMLMIPIAKHRDGFSLAILCPILGPTLSLCLRSPDMQGLVVLGGL
jgi:hypothetical protein